MTQVGEVITLRIIIQGNKKKGIIMKTKLFITIIISSVLSIFSTLAEASSIAKEDKRISPWKVENVHASILGKWKLEGYYENEKLVKDYTDDNLIWNITDNEISFNSDELGKGTTTYDIRRTIYRITPTMLILTEPDINLYHGKFIVENVNSTKLELVDWNDEVRFNLTRVEKKIKE